MATDGTDRQMKAVLGAVEAVLGDDLVAAYLFGSAVAGGLRPASDIDLLAITARPTTRDERMELARTLRPLSRRGERLAGWRPVELTVVVQSNGKPRIDFQYGEWLREDFDAGRVDPAEPQNPDLVVLLAQVRRHGRALRGPEAAELIPLVLTADLQHAMRGSVEGLLADLPSDTTNVLLTLARIWATLETGEFTTKDTAADWAAAQIPSGDALVRAGAMYRGEAPDEWAAGEANDAARELTDRIRV